MPVKGLQCQFGWDASSLPRGSYPTPFLGYLALWVGYELQVQALRSCSPVCLQLFFSSSENTVPRVSIRVPLKGTIRVLGLL